MMLQSIHNWHTRSFKRKTKKCIDTTHAVYFISFRRRSARIGKPYTFNVQLSFGIQTNMRIGSVFRTKSTCERISCRPSRVSRRSLLARIRLIARSVLPTRHCSWRVRARAQTARDKPQRLVEHGVDERQYGGGETVADGRVRGLVVRAAVPLGLQFQLAALGVPTAEQRGQPLGVRDVLDRGRDDPARLLEQRLVVPVRVDQRQLAGHAVVLAHPQRVHGGQVRLRVRPHVARLVARSARLARGRAVGQRHVVRHAVAGGVRGQPAARHGPQRRGLRPRRTVDHRPVQVVGGLVQLRKIHATRPLLGVFDFGFRFNPGWSNIPTCSLF